MKYECIVYFPLRTSVSLHCIEMGLATTMELSQTYRDWEVAWDLSFTIGNIYRPNCNHHNLYSCPVQRNHEFLIPIVDTQSQ